MKITNRQLIAMLNNIGVLKSDGEGKKVMPLKVSFAITRNNKIFEEEYKTYLEELGKLNNMYEVVVDNGRIDLENLSEEKREEYFEKIEELLEIEIEVTVQKVKEEDFGSYEPSLKELDLLGFMLDI